MFARVHHRSWVNHSKPTPEVIQGAPKPFSKMLGPL
jgi:hypothetical protein